MYPLIRRYLRRVDVLYLAICVLCSALSVVVLVSLGYSQLGSNNKASVQVIASLLGVMLAIVFSTVDYRALARAWPLHATVAWGLVLPTLFLHNVNTGVLTIGYDAGGTSNYSWYRVGGMTFQPAELAKISFILTLALHLSQLRGQVNKPKNLFFLLIHVIVPPLLIHLQGDDGTALVFLGIGLIMLYAGGLSHWLVGGVLVGGVVGGGALLMLKPDLLKGYQFQRIMAILTPEDPALSDITYQQNKGKHDSLNSAHLIKEFLFRDNLPINYDLRHQPRSQDLPDIAALNFAINILERQTMIECKNVVGYCPLIYTIDEVEATDIDNPLDFEFAEFVYKKGL